MLALRSALPVPFCVDQDLTLSPEPRGSGRSGAKPHTLLGGMMGDGGAETKSRYGL